MRDQMHSGGNRKEKESEKQKNKEMDYFYSRLDDMMKMAVSFPQHTGFLNPEQANAARLSVQRQKNDFSLTSNFTYLFCGGYAGAERQVLFLFPDYYDDEMIRHHTAGHIKALYICGSGYAQLSHRSFMGAILALGIERDTIGDIVVTSDHGAVVFADEPMARFLLGDGQGSSPLQYIGKDKVTVQPYIVPENFDAGRQFQKISDTVASPRLDCVVASLCNLSREKAKQTVESGIVSVNYEVITGPDKEVSGQDVIAVRGYGKFRLESVSEKTRRDRFRLSALKYI